MLELTYDNLMRLLNTFLNAAMFIGLLIAMRRQNKYIAQEKENATDLQTIRDLLKRLGGIQ